MKNFIRGEKGNFIALEGSYVFFVMLLFISILLPDLISIGRTAFYTHQAASMAVQRVEAQGEMTEEIADDIASYLEARGISEYNIYGTGSLKGIGDYEPEDAVVRALVVGKTQLRILGILPTFRTDYGVDLNNGLFTYASMKIGVSDVYIR